MVFVYSKGTFTGSALRGRLDPFVNKKDIFSLYKQPLYAA